MPHTFHLCAALLAGAALCLSTATAQNQALSFTNGGVDQYVDVPYHPTILPKGGVTGEAGSTYDGATVSPGNRWPTIMRQNSTPGAENMMLRVQEGTVASTTATTTATMLWFVRTTVTSTSVSWTFQRSQLTGWTHIAGTYDGTMGRLVVNGVTVAQAASSGDIVGSGGTLRLGNGDLSTPGAETWNGFIDEARLWPVARTDAEIQSLMNAELASVPGEVSTWNLNGNPFDSSGSNHGALTGNPPYVAGANIQFQLLTGAAYGNPTAGCAGVPRTGLTGLPKLGNPGHGFYAVRSLSATSGGAAFAWLSPLGTATAIPVLGIELWVDPSPPNIVVPTTVTPLKAAYLPLPIPNNPLLGGQTFVLQFLFIDPTCLTPFFASDALAVAITP